LAFATLDPTTPYTLDVAFDLDTQLIEISTGIESLLV
jgi:hypothetical protein